MTVGKAIFDLLLGDTDLRAIVNNRIFPEVAQQDAVLPYVVYNISSNEPSDTKREPSKLDTAQVEVNLYSTSYSECIDMATHVRAALDRVRGTYSGVNVQSIQYLGEVIDFDEAQRTYNITADYDVRISRTDFEIAQGSPITGVTLGELSDVDTTGVTDGQVIAYDAAAQEWQPADDAGGVTELGELDDVQFGQGGPEDGNVLLYDGDIWTNDTLQKSQIGLGNVDNTSDADKPVSSATQTALGAKANSADFSNVDNTSDADKPVSTATQTALNAKADTSAVPTDLNDLSDVSIVGTPAGNQALIYDATASAFKSQVSYTNRFEDDVETGLQIPTIFAERGYSVKAEGDGIYSDPSSDTPAAGKVIKRKIYHKTGFISDDDVIGDYTLIHTFADDTAYADTVAVFDAFEDGATYGVPPFTLFQTWEEVDAAPSFTGLLNETYGSGAEAAYSTRRLNGNVTDCMVIRRASDSTTTTIGFVDGDIDEAAIETFCTGTTCTVYQWLDQSGNDNTATAPSTGEEPTIYTGGALVKDNGKLALDFGGTSQLDFTTIAKVDVDPFAVFTVAQDTPNNLLFVDSTDNQADALLVFTYYGQMRSRWNGSTYIDGINSDSLYRLFSVIDDGTNPVNYYYSGELVTDAGYQVTNKAINLNRIGGTGYQASQKYAGIMQEAIFYASNKSTVRTDIEENIGDYFTQNTPLLDTYSGAAAAYSLRKLSSSYSGSAVEVYNGSSYASIGFNVFGELNTVALADHCGSNDGFVSKWYDQAGSNDAVQTNTARMPKIYDGATASVVKEGDKPSMDMSAGGTQLYYNSVLISQPLSFFMTGNNGGQNYAAFFDSYSDATNRVRFFDGNLIRDVFAGTGLSYTSSSNVYAIRSVIVDSTNSSIHFNGSQKASGDAGTNNYRFGRIGNWDGSNGTQLKKLQEFIIYDSNQSDNRTNIEDNINTFYNIYS